MMRRNAFGFMREAKMYDVAIVEDRPADTDLLRGNLERYAQQRDITFAIHCYSSATEFLSVRRTFDLVFFDIDLPGYTGMEAAGLLRSYDATTPIIFVTSLAQYALRGYEVGALDFMVKPVSYFDLSMRMSRALKVMDENRGGSVTVSTRDGFRVLTARSIEYVEVVDHYLEYHMVGEAEPVRQRASLSAAQEKLSGLPFVRISNCTLANMSQIRSAAGMELRMASGKVLYFSRARRKEALATINEYLSGAL